MADEKNQATDTDEDDGLHSKTRLYWAVAHSVTIMVFAVIGGLSLSPSVRISSTMRTVMLAWLLAQGGFWALATTLFRDRTYEALRRWRESNRRIFDAWQKSIDEKAASKSSATPKPLTATHTFVVPPDDVASVLIDWVTKDMSIAGKWHAAVALGVDGSARVTVSPGRSANSSAAPLFAVGPITKNGNEKSN